MDVERFTAELPALFDDFPRSLRPRGRRFDDVIEGVPNLAAENVLALLNLAASLLAPGESYVEVGTYRGASLIGAMRGNTGDFVAIDAFVFGEHEVRGRQLPAASRPGAGGEPPPIRVGERDDPRGGCVRAPRGRRARRSAGRRLLLRRAARLRRPVTRHAGDRALARGRGAGRDRRLGLGRGRAGDAGLPRRAAASPAPVRHPRRGRRQPAVVGRRRRARLV